MNPTITFARKGIYHGDHFFPAHSYLWTDIAAAKAPTVVLLRCSDGFPDAVRAVLAQPSAYGIPVSDRDLAVGPDNALYPQALASVRAHYEDTAAAYRSSDAQGAQRWADVYDRYIAAIDAALAAK